jgi:hypothetical protein
MKTIILLVTFLYPAICGSGEYTRHVSSENVIENRAGVIASVKRSSLSKRIEKFAVAHGADPVLAPELAELISVYEHPRVLAAIAAKESGFKLDARGSAGEVGAYQIIPKLHGHPGRTWGSQTEAAERLLNELISDAHGKLEPAVRQYNGSGPKAVRYARHVLSMARSI